MPLIRYRLSIILMAGSKYCQINFCYYITNSQAAPAPPQSSGILAILPSSNVRYCPQHPALLLGTLLHAATLSLFCKLFEICPIFQPIWFSKEAGSCRRDA